MMKRPLKNRIRIGLGMLMALSVMLVLQLVFSPQTAEITPSSQAANAEALTPLAGNLSTAPSGTVQGLRQKVTLSIGLLLLLCSAGVWWYTERRFFAPLEDMAGVVGAMSEGRLDQTLDTGAGTELDPLAEMINTFSVNQQEGLLFAWNQAGSGLQCIDELENYAKRAHSQATDPPVHELEAILGSAARTREYLEGIQDLVRTYYFYDVCLEDQKALAAEDAH